MTATLTGLTDSRLDVRQRCHRTTHTRTQRNGIQRYHDQLLTDFSQYHQLIYEALQNQASQNDWATTGTVYPEYADFCTVAGLEPRSQRRDAEYLDYFERLGIIAITKHYGDQHGKTCEIQLE